MPLTAPQADPERHTITDPDAYPQRLLEESDDLDAARGIVLAMVLGLLIWVVVVWWVF